MPMFEHDDVFINYAITGEGPRVLFFNGSGATLASSALFIDALSRTCTVLAHDQRGLGKTSVPDGPYSMADYANDGAALLDHVGWDTCAVVGMSFGGMVAQEFAVRHGARIERMALLCTSAGGSAGSSYPLHELGSLSAAERAAKVTTLTDSRWTPEFLAAHPADAAIVAAREEAARIPKSDQVMRGERLQLQARIGHDVADRLGSVRTPTFVMAGRYDGIAPVSNSEAIVSLLVDARLKTYEGGHLFTAQDRSAIADLRSFLADGTRP